MEERRVMTEPGGRGSPRAARVSESGLGTEGDGWNDDFQFTARSPRGSDGGKRTPPRSPRGGAGASSTGTRNPTGAPVGGADAETSPGSGSSRGSPDENQNAGQIPGASGRRRSFTDGFTAPSTDPTASPPAPQRRSVSPFEQRRRQALLDKQRRLEDMMERIRAPDSPEKAGDRRGQSRRAHSCAHVADAHAGARIVEHTAGREHGRRSVDPGDAARRHGRGDAGEGYMGRTRSAGVDAGEGHVG